MTASTIIEYNEKFGKWTVRKRGIYRDDVVLHSSLNAAVWDARQFLQKEKEHHDKGASNDKPTS